MLLLFLGKPTRGLTHSPGRDAPWRVRVRCESAAEENVARSRQTKRADNIQIENDSLVDDNRLLSK